jgi:hypothetical protein
MGRARSIRPALGPRARAAAMAVVALAGGCAQEDVVDLDPAPRDATSASPGDARTFDSAAPMRDASVTVDAWAPDVDASRDGDAWWQASDGAAPLDADAAGDGSNVCMFPATRACEENGAPCIVSAECCSLRCVDNVCLAAGNCAGPMMTCTSRLDCCSGRCEPEPFTRIRICTNYCLPAGAPCMLPFDCCSTGCHAGVCAAAVCAQVGQPCALPSDCCSGMCPPGGGTCMRDILASCGPTGESCGAGIITPCCGDTCDADSGTCMLGPGPCLENGSPCVEDEDCCHGACSPNANGGKVCSAPCAPDGGACAASSDCCGERCTGLPSACAPLGVACRKLGSSCTAPSDCCSSQCIDGICASECDLP